MLQVQVIYEDRDFIAVNKPAGLLVHEDKKSSGKETLVSWLLEKFPEISGVGDDPKTRPGIAHRLDKDTSGVIVVARNNDAFKHLKYIFQNHKISKTYLALVWGKLKSGAGVINKAIGLKSGTILRTTVLKNAKLIKEAVTEYKVLKFLKYKDYDFTLLEVKPKTGRTHQIRVHLNFIGHPIVGDALYGKSTAKTQVAEDLGLKRQFLHSESLEFSLLDGSRLKLSADLPPDLEQALALLKAVPADYRIHN